VTLLVIAFARPASANGRFPASSAVVLGSGDTMLVRATFGLLVSADRGKSFGYVCERAVGFSGIEDPAYAITPSGAIVAATFEGLAVSRDHGCEWSFAGGPRKWMFVDLTTEPDGTLWAIRSTYSATTDAGIRYENALFVSRDDATSFAQVGAAIDPSLLLESVEVAGARVYVSGVRGEGAEREGVLLVSRDGGATLDEKRVPMIAGERAPFVSGVEGERVWIRTAGDPSSRLLAFEGGAWRVALESKTPLLGFALGGGEVLAGSRDGLFVVGDGKRAPLEVQCLRGGAGVLWACSSERSGFVVGASKDGGRTFDRKIHFADLRPLACAPTAAAARLCGEDWAKLKRELLIPDAPREERPSSRLPWIAAFAGLVFGGVLAWLARRRRAKT
jgi:hypothetical protein